MILSHTLNGILMYDSSAVCGGEKAMRWAAQLRSGAHVELPLTEGGRRERITGLIEYSFKDVDQIPPI
jgi:hypothetical protein